MIATGKHSEEVAERIKVAWAWALVWRGVV